MSPTMASAMSCTSASLMHRVVSILGSVLRNARMDMRYIWSDIDSGLGIDSLSQPVRGVFLRFSRRWMNGSIEFGLGLFRVVFVVVFVVVFEVVFEVAFKVVFAEIVFAKDEDEEATVISLIDGGIMVCCLIGWWLIGLLKAMIARETNQRVPE